MKIKVNRYRGISYKIFRKKGKKLFGKLNGCNKRKYSSRISQKNYLMDFLHGSFLSLFIQKDTTALLNFLLPFAVCCFTENILLQSISYGNLCNSCTFGLVCKRIPKTLQKKIRHGEKLYSL